MSFKLFLKQSPFKFYFGLLLALVFLLSPLLFGSRVFADIDGLVGKINQHRSANGLGPLTEDQSLTNAACWLAADNAAQNKSGHTDSLGRDMASRLVDFGVSGGSRSENVAAWTDKSKGAYYAFDLWKNSSGHNANMLGGNYTRIGIGQAFSNSGWRYVVADFASGTATTLTNQCGSVLTQSNPNPAPKLSPPPAPAAKLTPPQKPNPPAIPPPSATNQTQTETPTPTKPAVPPTMTSTKTVRVSKNVNTKNLRSRRRIVNRVLGVVTRNELLFVSFLVLTGLGAWWYQNRKHHLYK